MSITSEEVNLLVYRYLQESGFTHSAFTFAYESLLAKSSVAHTDLPPGSLITFLQKGLQYVRIEQSIDEAGPEALSQGDLGAGASLLHPAVMEKAARVKKNAVSKLQNRREAAEAIKDAAGNGDGAESAKDGPEQRDGKRKRTEENGKDDRKEEHNKAGGSHGDAMQVEPAASAADGDSATSGDTNNATSTDAEENAGAAADRGVAPAIANGARPTDVAADRVGTLSGHRSDIYMCSWNAKHDLLATGSGDGTAKIWDLGGGDAKIGELAARASKASLTLSHHGPSDPAQGQQAGGAAAQGASKSFEVATLDWSHCGNWLATGGYDGVARIWGKDGALKHRLAAHGGPIFSMKWNAAGTRVVTGSYDRTAIVWDPMSGSALQTLTHHTAPTLDVDWKDDECFATCSSDHSVAICTVGRPGVDATFIGHQDEVNAVRWDPTKTVLASCSDDSTAKIWKQDSPRCVADLVGHEKEIYTIEWAPSGGSKGVLASASFDTTVKLWDVEAQKPLHTLRRHTSPVNSVTFSGSGDLVASGSTGGDVLVWSVKDGSIVKSYTGNGNIYILAWKGDKLAIGLSSSVVDILDLRI